MKPTDMIVLRALGALLAYPSPELREALPEIEAAIVGAPLIATKNRQALLGLIELLRDSDPLWSEERYVELFDRGRATSLHLFEHLHGEARDRGEAMVELKLLYERGGFTLTANELPDYLPVVLEYLSCRDLAETEDVLGDCAPILRRIGEALLQRKSTYATIFETLLAIVGQAGLDPRAAARRGAVAEKLDDDWEEQPAFATPKPALSEGEPP